MLFRTASSLSLKLILELKVKLAVHGTNLWNVFSECALIDLGMWGRLQAKEKLSSDNKVNECTNELNSHSK